MGFGEMTRGTGEKGRGGEFGFGTRERELGFRGYGLGIMV